METDERKLTGMTASTGVGVATSNDVNIQHR